MLESMSSTCREWCAGVSLPWSHCTCAEPWRWLGRYRSSFPRSFPQTHQWASCPRRSRRCGRSCFCTWWWWWRQAGLSQRQRGSWALPKSSDEPPRYVEEQCLCGGSSGWYLAAQQNLLLVLPDRGHVARPDLQLVLLEDDCSLRV